MKKMTKILSLALALALVLGMTAMAAEPSKILYNYNFDDAKLGDGTYSVEKFRENSYDLSTVNEAVASSTFTKGAGRYYRYNGGIDIQVIDGKPYLVEPASAQSKIAYSFDQPWNRDASKALVVLTNVVPVESRSVQYGMAYPLWNAKIKDATNESENNKGYMINEDGSLKLVEAYNQHAFGFNKTAWGGATGYNGETTAAWTANEPQIAGYVVKSANLYNVPGEYLSTFNIIGHTTSYPTGINTLESTTTIDEVKYNTNGEQITGLTFYSDTVNEMYFGETLVFEVSTAGTDVKFDQTEYTNVPVEDKKLELIWSMPVVKHHHNSRGSLAISSDYAANYVVNDGEKDLVYNEDYTVDYDVKVVGDAVKGVVTFNLNDMDYDKTYTVSIAAAKQPSYARVSNTAAQTATFATEAAPSYALSISASEGLSAGGAAVTADAMAGKTVYFTANATNTTGRAIDGIVTIGIYDAEGNLVKFAAANKAFATDGTNSFAAAFKMETGYTAKAYVKGTASEIAFQ